MPLQGSTGDEKENMEDFTSDFAYFKISALKKVARISMTEIKNVTIGPQATANKSDTNDDTLENRQDEHNSCNLKKLQRMATTPIHHTVSTSNGVSFSVRKTLQQSELQRKEEVRKKMEQRIQHMSENSRAIKERIEKMRTEMANERERKTAEDMARVQAEAERLAKEEHMKWKHKQQLHAQSIQEEKERNAREQEEYRKQMKEKEELMTVIVTQRGHFTAKYCDIVLLSTTCKNKHALNMFLTTHGARIRDLYQQIEGIDEKIRSGNVVATDVNSVEALVHHIEDMLNLFRTEMEKADARYEAELARKAQINNEAQVAETESITVDKAIPFQQPTESNVVEKEDENQSVNAVTTQEVAALPSVTNTLAEPSTLEIKPEEASKDSAECKEDRPYEYADLESLNIYNRSRQFLAAYKQSYKEFLQLPDTKKIRFDCQKAINIPVNAIAGTSGQHLKDKYDRLQKLLSGKLLPNVTWHPQGTAFCKDHLAKKIVNQGETLVSSKPEMAFPIAAIIIALWNEHHDFGQLVLAHLHEACPFTVPIFPLQQEGQSNEDYYKSLGCKYTEDGTFEMQDKYLRRMSGLMRLYASITITGQRRYVEKPHPHSLKYAWRWIAAVLNIEPRADTVDLCATLILDMLEVAGNDLWTAYPCQFRKLLMLLAEQYYPRMQRIAGASGGPLVRLEEFLKNSLTRGNIHPPDGILAPNFW